MPLRTLALGWDNHLSQSIQFHPHINKNQTLPFCSTIAIALLSLIHPFLVLTMSQPNQHKKSSVARTCNQLSLFLKEKGCLRDLQLGINAKSDDTAARMTVDLLSNMENPNPNPQTEKLVNLKAEDTANRSAAQMTIFYDGQVIVLDDVPADRARDVLSAAGTETPRVVDQLASEPCKAREAVRVNGLDLPIARRASLHKFLAKRKDRAGARAPYPLPDAGPLKHEHNFDLNL